jgi:hypothetical protein
MFTATMPISHAAPSNGYHGSPASAASPQTHATMEHGGMNPNTTMGFTMVGWPASLPPMVHKASPYINVSLTPQAFDVFMVPAILLSPDS